jgi:hypothetical protein
LNSNARANEARRWVRVAKAFCPQEPARLLPRRLQQAGNVAGTAGADVPAAQHGATDSLRRTTRTPDHKDAIVPELKARFLRGDLPEQTQLKKLYLIGEDESGSPRLTVSGVLLLTPRPADFLSSAYVQCVAYSGTERNAEYQLDAQDCDGPVDEQIRFAFNFVKRNMRVEAVKRPGRIDIPQYDLAAVFEAIVNAVAHRDYSMHGARIRLHLFADRLELSTPGGLPNSLTIDSMKPTAS